MFRVSIFAASLETDAICPGCSAKLITAIQESEYGKVLEVVSRKFDKPGFMEHVAKESYEEEIFGDGKEGVDVIKDMAKAFHVVQLNFDDSVITARQATDYGIAIMKEFFVVYALSHTYAIGVSRPIFTAPEEYRTLKDAVVEDGEGVYKLTINKRKGIVPGNLIELLTQCFGYSEGRARNMWTILLATRKTYLCNTNTEEATKLCEKAFRHIGLEVEVEKR